MGRPGEPWIEASSDLPTTSSDRIFESMQSHELLREVFQKANPKEAAAQLNLSLSMVYKWTEPPREPNSGAVNPLDRVAALLECTKDHRIAQWICQRAGGFFIANPPRDPSDTRRLMPATNQIVQEFADLLAVIATAASDNQITSQEAQRIRASWEELKSVTEGFVRCCEQGDFGPLKDHPAPFARPGPSVRLSS